MAVRREDLLVSFRRHLRAAAKAPRTIGLYSQSVRYYGRWLTDRGRAATLDELTRHAVAAWLAELTETCEPSNVGTRLPGMRRVYRWLVTEGELEKAPTDGIEISRPPDEPGPILTDEEIAALLKAYAVGRGRPVWGLVHTHADRRGCVPTAMFVTHGTRPRTSRLCRPRLIAVRVSDRGG
ncbi:phage integrase N-terminal SAM-like domain-containing protein [Geodermatophilus sp. SYSU D01186]